MLPIANGVGLLHDARPSTCSRPGDDGTIRNIGWNNLEFGSITAIEDRTVIHDLDGRIYCREVTSVRAHIYLV